MKYFIYFFRIEIIFWLFDKILVLKCLKYEFFWNENRYYFFFSVNNIIFGKMVIKVML